MSINAAAASSTSLNRLLLDRGGSSIPALDNLPAAEAEKLKEGLQKFDQVASELSKNPVFGALANSDAMKFLRDLAKTVSTQAEPTAAPASAEPVFQGFCGGRGRSAPPPAPPAPPPPPAAAPPVAQTPPEPAAPPVVAAPPAPTTPPVNVAPPAAKPDPVAPPASPVALGGGTAQALSSGGAAAQASAAAAAQTAGTAAGAAPGQVDLAGITQAFGQRFAQMLQQNPLAAILSLGALGSVLGSGGFNPLSLNGANNGAQAASTGNAQALASTGGTNQVAAPPSATPGTGNAELDAMIGAGGKGMTFEDKVATMMVDIIKKMQEDIEKRLEKLKAQAQAAESGGGGGGGKGGGMLGSVLGMAGNMIMPGVGGAVGGMVGNAIGGAAGGGGAGGAGGGQESRNIEFEMLKNEMQKLSQMQQAFSNVLNEMHQLAMNAIRGIAK